VKILIFCACLLCPIKLYAAEASAPPAPQEGEASETPRDEPRLYDHYVSLKRMQEHLAGRSLEDQAKLQPQIQRAQRKACEQLRKDHSERISRDEYRREGGNEFLVFSLELEQWCQTSR
jgi:hypothetical protein